MSNDATYMGEPANQGRLVPREPHESEGFAVLQCGGTSVVLTYTVLHELCGHVEMGRAGAALPTNGLPYALRAITCEASIGNRAAEP